MSRYLIHFLLGVLCWTAALLGFNWKVDPHGIFHPNKRTSPEIQNERIFKTVYLATQPANTLLLGTSRVDLGFTGDQFNDTHNLALFGQPIHETTRLLQHALSFNTPKQVLVGLDFFAFNGLIIVPSDYSESNFDPMRQLHLLYSFSTAVDSWKVLRNKNIGSDGCCDSNGFHTIKPLENTSIHDRFLANERFYLIDKYLPFPSCSYTLNYSHTNYGVRSTLDDLRILIDLTRKHNIALTLFITPSHARQWETIAIAGLWSQWEDWKRQIVQLNQANGNAANVWDFSGYSRISTEAVPPANVLATMHGYTDSAHFTPAIGGKILARLQGATEPSDFGIRLTTDNIETHLAQIRADQTRYQSENSLDIAEIQNLANKVAKEKRCLGKAR